MTFGTPFEQPWTGHDRLARQLSRGMAQGARELMGLMLGIALVLTGLAVLLVPGPATYGVLVIVLALPTSLRVGRGTEQAVEAVRSLWLAPGTARGQWLQGWAHLALLQGPAWAAAGMAAVAWHEGLSGAALYVFGAVLVAQALSAWGAFTLRRQMPHEWRFLAVFGSVVLGGLCGNSRPLGEGGLVPLGWAGLVFGAGGAGLLWWLWRQLRQLQPGHRPRPEVANTAPWGLGRWLRGWAVMDVGGGQRGAGQVLMATLNPILMVAINPGWYQQSQWQQPYGPAKLLELGFLTLLITPSLVHQPYHWRQWLKPGGVQRQRLGWRILMSNLKLQCLTLVMAAAVGAATAWGLGTSPQAIGDIAQRSWPLLVEWDVATALAVAWAGLYATRRSGAWLFGLAIVAPAAWVGILWLRDGALPTTGMVDGVYIGQLLVALAASVGLANAVWAKADLHRLMQDHKPRALRWWED